MTCTSNQHPKLQHSQNAPPLRPSHASLPVNDVACKYRRYGSMVRTQGSQHRPPPPPGKTTGQPAVMTPTGKWQDILRVIQILLLFYFGRAHMEFLLTLAVGGRKDRHAPARIPSSPHPYGGMGNGNNGLDLTPPAVCLQVGSGCAPGPCPGHDSVCVVGKPSPVKQRRPAYAVGLDLAPTFASKLCHRPLPSTLGLAPPETSEFFSES